MLLHAPPTLNHLQRWDMGYCEVRGKGGEAEDFAQATGRPLECGLDSLLVGPCSSACLGSNLLSFQVVSRYHRSIGERTSLPAA